MIPGPGTDDKEALAWLIGSIVFCVAALVYATIF